MRSKSCAVRCEINALNEKQPVSDVRHLQIFSNQEGLRNRREYSFSVFLYGSQSGEFGMHIDIFGTLSFRVAVEGTCLAVICPMIYLEESLIEKLHQFFSLPLLDHTCPFEAENIRMKVKKSVTRLDTVFDTEGFQSKVVEALENIDLTSIWTDLREL